MMAAVVDHSQRIRRKPRIDQDHSRGIQLCPVWSGAAMPTIPLAIGRYSIGADPGCDISLPMNGVEEKHCLVVVGHKRVLIQAYSRFTWVNEGAVTEGQLEVGDRLAIGPVEFVVENLSSAQDSVATASYFPPLEMDESVQQAIFRKSSPDKRTGSRREALIGEMLEDVQGLLDQYLQREKASKAEISSKNHALADAQSELEQAQSLFSRQCVELEEEWKRLANQKQHVEEIDVAQAKLLQLKTQIENQAAGVARREAELKPQRSQLLQLAEEIGREKMECQLELQNLQAARAELVASTVGAEELEERRQELQQLHLEIQSEHENVASQKQQLDTQYQDIQAQRAELEREFSGLEIRYQKLKDSEAEAYERQLVQTQRARELDDRELKLESELKSVSQKLEDIDLKENQILQFQQELDDHIEAVELERQQLQELKLHQEQGFAQERQQHQEFQASLQAQELHWEQQRSKLLEREIAAQEQLKELNAESARLAEQAQRIEDQRQALRAAEQSYQTKSDLFAEEHHREQESIQARKWSLEKEELRLLSLSQSQVAQLADLHVQRDSFLAEKQEFQACQQALKIREEELHARLQEFQQIQQQCAADRAQLQQQEQQLRTQQVEQSREAEFHKERLAEVENRQADVESFTQELEAAQVAFKQEQNSAEAKLAESRAALVAEEERLQRRLLTLQEQEADVLRQIAALAADQARLQMRIVSFEEEQFALTRKQGEQSQLAEQLRTQQAEQAREAELIRERLSQSEDRKQELQVFEKSLQEERLTFEQEQAESRESVRQSYEAIRTEKFELEEVAARLARQEAELKSQSEIYEQEIGGLRVLEDVLKERSTKIRSVEQRLEQEAARSEIRLADLREKESSLQFRIHQFEEQFIELKKLEQRVHGEQTEFEATRTALTQAYEGTQAAQAQRAAELQSRLAELDAQNEELLAAQEDVNRSHLALAAERAELDQLAEELIQREAETQTIQVELHLREEQIEARSADLQTRMASVDQLADELNAQQQELAQQSAELVARERQLLEQSQATTKASAAQLAADREELAVWRVELEAQQAEQKQQRIELEELQAECTRTQSEVAAKEIKLTEQQVELRSGLEKLEDSASALRSRQAELSDREANLQDRKQELEQRLVALEQQEMQLTETLDQLEPGLDKHVESLSLERLRLEQLEAQIIDRQRSLERWQVELENRDRERVQEAAEEIELQQRRLDDRARDLTEQTRLLTLRQEQLLADSENQRAEYEVEKTELLDQIQQLVHERHHFQNLNVQDAPVNDFVEDQQAKLQQQQHLFEHKLGEVETQLKEIEVRRSNLDQQQRDLEAERLDLQCSKEADEEERLRNVREKAALEQSRVALEKEKRDFVEQRQLLALEFSQEDIDQFIHTNTLIFHPDDVSLPLEMVLDEEMDPGPSESSETQPQGQLPDDAAPSAEDSSFSQPADELESVIDVSSNLSLQAESEPTEQEDEALDSLLEEIREQGNPSAHHERAGNDPESALTGLRSELAEIFGIHTFGRRDAEVEESTDAELLDEGAAPELDDTGSWDAESSCDNQKNPEDEPEPVEEEYTLDFSDGGEDAVQRYMEQLLARNRGHCATFNPRKQERAAETSQSPAATHDEKDATPVAVAESVHSDPPGSESVVSEQKTKRTEAPDKETVRASLNSFRELANISARTAVAKSSLSRVRTESRYLSATTLLGWGATLALFSYELTAKTDFGIWAYGAGAVSLISTIPLGVSYLRIRKLEQQESGRLPVVENEEMGEAASET